MFWSRRLAQTQAIIIKCAGQRWKILLLDFPLLQALFLPRSINTHAYVTFVSWKSCVTLLLMPLTFTRTFLFNMRSIYVNISSVIGIGDSCRGGNRGWYVPEAAFNYSKVKMKNRDESTIIWQLCLTFFGSTKAGGSHISWFSYQGVGPNPGCEFTARFVQ